MAVHIRAEGEANPPPPEKIQLSEVEGNKTLFVLNVSKRTSNAYALRGFLDYSNARSDAHARKAKCAAYKWPHI